MKRIPLTQGKFALVDDADFPWLNQWKWYAQRNNWNNYNACRANPSGSHLPLIRMHRVILGARKGQCVDHIDGNTLNNTRKNIRKCRQQQNSCNRRKQAARTTTPYKGVHMRAQNGNFIARIAVRNTRIYLGDFATAKAAAMVYDMAARRLHGQFAHTNFKRREG